MHAAACVYDFVYRDLVLITRLQIHHSSFDIRYSLFVIFHPFRRSHFVSNRRLSYARRGVRLRFRIPGFGSYHPSPNSSFIIRYSLFDIRYFPSILPFAFRVKPAFIVCTPRRAFTISYTGIWLLSPVCDFVIKIPHSSVSSGKGSRP